MILCSDRRLSFGNGLVNFSDLKDLELDGAFTVPGGDAVQPRSVEVSFFKSDRFKFERDS